ncbi:hypothetical protein BVG16_21810 [Paenibacillus selenitireducens]|uniref:Uncharacterized protein n=1 Tax=Paenibacillus selenitireducens TaxID=1324314 RepID=A0A1T2X5T0_9BACL|nr:hypothetical protein [Paenibacillus selenitireducens]OPA75238.1 hypothetical protein BVG16_21810 [Paenibacillus selenitireducens]
MIVVKKNVRIKQNLLQPERELSNQPQETQDVLAEATMPPLSAFQRIGGMEGLMHMLGNIQQMYGLYLNMQPTFKMLNALMAPQVTVSSLASKRARGRKKITKRRKR